MSPGSVASKQALKIWWSFVVKSFICEERKFKFYSEMVWSVCAYVLCFSPNVALYIINNHLNYGLICAKIKSCNLFKCSFANISHVAMLPCSALREFFSLYNDGLQIVWKYERTWILQTSKVTKLLFLWRCADEYLFRCIRLAANCCSWPSWILWN